MDNSTAESTAGLLNSNEEHLNQESYEMNIVTNEAYFV